MNAEIMSDSLPVSIATEPIMASPVSAKGISRSAFAANPINTGANAFLFQRQVP